MRRLLAACLTLAAAPVAGDPVLSFPLDCQLGETCHIQQFVDRDPGPGARDYSCGTLSYEGHKGTDFALPTQRDMHAGVNVLAAAPGVVRGTRNVVPDRLYTPENAADVDGRECGNGVVIDHGDGWETQYCHLKQGTVTVKSGDIVDVGTVLGQVGLSGKTQFPHLHLSVRKDDQVVDPFDTTDRAQCGAGGTSLWADAPAYVPGAVIEVGFAPYVPEFSSVTAGTSRHDSLPADAGGLVLYGLAFGGLKGDMMRIEIDGPDGPFGEHQVELERNRARFFRAFGKRLRADRWPAGTYTGRVTLLRDGRPISRRTTTTVIE